MFAKKGTTPLATKNDMHDLQDMFLDVKENLEQIAIRLDIDTMEKELQSVNKILEVGVFDVTWRFLNPTF